MAFPGISCGLPLDFLWFSFGFPLKRGVVLVEAQKLTPEEKKGGGDKLSGKTSFGADEVGTCTCRGVIT